MDELMTKGEQNLLLLEATIPANERFFVWCYGEDGRLIATSCPEAEREVLEEAFHILGGTEKLKAYAASHETRPILIGTPIGMQWAATLETERGRSLVFVMGPVFYSLPSEIVLHAALRPYRDTLKGAAWASRMMTMHSRLPAMPFAILPITFASAGAIITTSACLASATCSTLYWKLRSNVSMKHLFDVSVSKVIGLMKFVAFSVMSTCTLQPSLPSMRARFAIL